jgi:anti-sigma regulatory factor (Ser/Thr protein kinase)
MNDHSKNTLQILLRGNLEEINHLALAIEQFCEGAGIDDLIKNQVNLILEELYTNTANYGFQGITNGEVTITLSVIDDQLLMTYQDNGIAFDPLEMEDPDLMLSLDDRAIGGLGVFFVKALTDHVEYHRVGEFNQLKMNKSLLPKAL